MLGSLYLTKSKIRGKSLGILFSNPSRKYYLSELARLVGTFPGNVQRELSGFVKDRLITREKKGSLVFYVLNSRHAFFRELESLTLKTWGIEGALQTLVEKKKEIQLALLYGSFAKGTEHGESDIDLLMVSDGDLKDFYVQLRHLESVFGREINPTVYSPVEFEKKAREKDTFVRRILEEPHHLLKGALRDFKSENSKGIRAKS